MFGYIKTDTPNLYVKDTVLYRGAYCGLCKSIGKSCGQVGRFVLNYDLTFFSLFVHNLLGEDMEITKQHCVIHPLTKRPIAKVTTVSEKVAALNVILAYHKLNDDVFDEKKGRIKRIVFSNAYKKAVKLQPELDEIVKRNYKDLVRKETENCLSIDMVSDCFAKMLEEVGKEFLGEKFNDKVALICYNLGKWIYLIDALDDFDKDKKKNSYNVFILNYPDSESKKDLLEKNGKDLTFVFGSVLSEIANANSGIPYPFNHDLIDNVLYRGLTETTKSIMEIN